jgi:hypothetical protein
MLNYSYIPPNSCSKTKAVIPYTFSIIYIRGAPIAKQQNCDGHRSLYALQRRVSSPSSQTKQRETEKTKVFYTTDDRLFF